MRGVLRPAAAVAVGTLLAALAVQAPAQTVPGGAPPGGIPGEPARPGVSATPAPPPPASVPIVPSPSPSPSPGTTPSPGASPKSAAGAGASTPSGPPANAQLVQFSGQLLDFRSGYVFFTTGDAFKAASPLKIVDYTTQAPTPLVPAPPLYARATIDPATGNVTQLALTKKKLAQDSNYLAELERAHQFAATGSPKSRAPELEGGTRITGKRVTVKFEVTVPPTTPLTDDVYLTTDADAWIPNALKMDRVDAIHYTLNRTYASGTKFAYHITRGTWTSVEVGEDGLQDDPHQFFVKEEDAQVARAIVYRWSDQTGTQPEAGPNAIPTPFNPNPFGGFPSTLRPGQPAPSPTPRP